MSHMAQATLRIDEDFDRSILDELGVFSRAASGTTIDICCKSDELARVRSIVENGSDLDDDGQLVDEIETDPSLGQNMTDSFDDVPENVSIWKKGRTYRLVVDGDLIEETFTNKTGVVEFYSNPDNLVIEEEDE